MSPLVLQPITKPVRMVFTGKPVVLPEEVQVAINRHWDAQIQAGKKYTRGDLFTIEGITPSESELTVSVASTDYAHYVATQAKVPACDAYPCTCLYTAVLLRTADDRSVFGEMAGWTSTPGNFTWIGGGITKHDLMLNNLIDIQKNAETELFEETGLDCSNKQQIGSVLFSHLRTGGKWNSIGAIFTVITNLTSTEVEQVFQQHNESLREKGEEPELTRLVYLTDGQEMKDFFTTYEQRLEDSLLAVLRDRISQTPL